uniref:NADH-ubiquinone oxidoreductase chain 3 n=1 Tax=Colpocephalum griffoneae TaxID=2358484 RepID=A0A386B2N4_9NEOP|nr:NADH dehydrogenase subunit 3 [Colpocephalum griffoneae]AYC65903.1 NADH dehydrogenase subunit 3 [Colpocephalum griffoneae]
MLKMVFFTFFICVVIIGSLVLLISMFFMENKSNEVGESPFECGFEPISYSRTPFSIQFFSITIIFLIFDLEIVIILPLLKSNQHYALINLLMTLIVLVLLGGLIVEWYDGSLDWSV